MLRPLLIEEDNLMPRTEAEDAGDLASGWPRERGPPSQDLPGRHAKRWGIPPPQEDRATCSVTHSPA